MYSQCVISVFVAQYITATGHSKVLHLLKILLSAITLVFSEPLMTSNRYPAERFGRAQNGPTFDRQNTIFAASKLLDEIASGRLNSNIWDHWGINKHIRQNYSLVHIHFKMNSINWPAPNIWVFIAQLVEHCSANAEAMGSNPVEALKSFFFFFRA